MIEPPKTPEGCAAIFELAGFRINFQYAENVYLANATKMAEILNELEALRALTNELAASNCMTMNEEDTEYCIFCGRFKWSGHEGNCLVERAKELVKA